MNAETLYLTWHERLERYFTSRIGAEEAQDLTHDLFVRYLDAVTRLGPIDDPKHWLWRSAHNLMVDHVRHAQSLPLTEQLDDAELVDTEDDTLPLIEERLDHTDQYQQAMHGLNSLSPAQQEVVVLRFWNDWRYVQVANALGISSGAARARGLRGLQQLAAIMTR